MDTWRFRIVIFMALAIFLFSDFLGYGNAKAEKHISRRASPTLREQKPNIFLDEDTSMNDFETMLDDQSGDGKTASAPTGNAQMPQIKTIHLTDEMKEACLPKMLCEMAAKSPDSLSDKEKKLLSLIGSTTLSLSGLNTKYHFATHMGQLMRYSGDPFGGVMGCAEMWPLCPFTSKLLLQLSGKIVLT